MTEVKYRQRNNIACVSELNDIHEQILVYCNLIHPRTKNFPYLPNFF